VASTTEIIAGTAVEIAFLALALGVLYRVWGKFLPTPRRQRVLAFQRGVLFKRDGSSNILGPGDHWISSKRSVLLCDMRSKPYQVSAQDVAMGDGMAMRLSLMGECRVANPEIFVTQSSDPFGAFYLEARQAIHQAARDLEGASTLNDPHLLTSRVRELLVPRAAHLGLDVTQLDITEILPVGWFRQS
jgi:hypothetical protein